MISLVLERIHAQLKNKSRFLTDLFLDLRSSPQQKLVLIFQKFPVDAEFYRKCGWTSLGVSEAAHHGRIVHSISFSETISMLFVRWFPKFISEQSPLSTCTIPCHVTYPTVGCPVPSAVAITGYSRYPRY